MRKEVEIKFYELYYEYSAQLKYHVYKILKDIDDSEDALQITWIKVCKALDDGVILTNPKNWLYTVATRTAYDVYRKKVVRQKFSAFSLSDTERAEQLQENYSVSIYPTMYEALKQILTKDLLYLIAAYQDGIQVMATNENVSYEKVENKIYRIRKRVKKIYKKVLTNM